MAAAAVPAAAGAAKKAAGTAAGGASKPKGAELPQRGSWRARAQEGGTKSRNRALSGSAGRWRRLLIAEFIVCVMLLGLSPLAKAPGEMGPVRFMKRGSATCALFIILGLVSSMGRGAGKAAAAFGGLVVLVLLVDQREAFGRLATVLAANEADDEQTGIGPDESTDDDGPSTAEV